MKKKLLCIILAALMLASLLPGVALAAEGELVTSVSTEEDLRAFAASVNAGNDYAGVTVTLNNDIELTQPWTPIGISMEKPFKGTFNGNDHTISGLSLTVNEQTVEDGTEFGLFGRVDGGNIQSLTVTGNINIVFQTGYQCPAARPEYVGGIAGQLMNGSISDCAGYISIAAVNGGCIGGIVGEAYQATISNTANYAKLNISVTAHNDDYVGIDGATEDMAYANSGLRTFTVGGIAGYVVSGSTVDSCINYGSIKTNVPTSFVKDSKTGVVTFYDSQVGEVAGIAGSVSKSSFMNCANKGVIGDKVRYMAGICNVMSASSKSNLINCYNSGSLSLLNKVRKPDQEVGETLGCLATWNPRQEYDKPNVSNCYNIGLMTYKTGITYQTLGYDTTANPDDAAMITTENLGEAYKADDTGVNGGYPLLA